MKKILVVDDEETKIKKHPIGKAIVSVAKKIEVAVDFIDSSEKAVENLRGKSKEYTLILMDGQFNNCKLQGPQAVREIRKFSSIPIIMISSSGLYNAEGIKNGADDFIRKVNIPGELEKKLKKLLDPSYRKKGISPATAKEIMNHVAMSFLPLDIDMQALAHENVKNKDDYLKEMYFDNVDYLQKLIDFQFIVIGNDKGKISASVKRLMENCPPLANRYDGKDKHFLLELTGITNEEVAKFFEMLSARVNDAEKIINHNWGISNITSFHDWYCELVNLLRKEV